MDSNHKVKSSTSTSSTGNNSKQENSIDILVKPPKPKRWTLDRLEQKYSSSKDLYRDIRQLEQEHRPRIKKSSSKLPKIEKVKKKGLSKSSPTKHETTGPSSIDWRLGELVLTESLGDHLLSVGTDGFRQIMLTFSGFDFPKSWSSLRDLKAARSASVNNFDESSSDYRSTAEILDIWLYSTLTAGAIRSWHSAIIGQTALTDAPRQKFGDSLLDLRSCGIARKEAVYNLLNRCLSKTLESKFIREPDGKSLEVLALMLSAFGDFKRFELMFELLKLSVNHLKFLSKKKMREENEKERLIFKEFFEFFFNIDITFHSQVESAGPLYLTLEEIRKMSRDSDSIKFTDYVDPEACFSKPIPQDPTELTDMYWKQGQSVLYNICILRNLVDKPNVSRIDMEEACSKFILIQQRIRQVQESVYRSSSTSSPDNISSAYRTSILGPEHISYSRALRIDESTNTFLLYDIIDRLSNRFRDDDDSRFLMFKRQVEEMMDEQIKLNLELMEFIFKDLDRKKILILSGDFTSHVNVVQVFSHLPRGWRYLAKWRRKYPEYTFILARVVRVWKYISFGKPEFIQYIAEYEDEEQMYSLYADEPPTWLALDQPPVENSHSPDISDFQLTLSYR